MLNQLISFAGGMLMLLASLVILHRGIQLIKSLNKSAWRNEKCRFLLLSLSIAMAMGGAWAVYFNIPWGAKVLLIGVGGKIGFDRRLKDAQRFKILNPQQRQAVRTNPTLGI